ncbi:sigma-54-dependent Fis family transcriptional regulator [Alloacidobacterium dinghuense]|uniref:Sigma-54-dependent Fis family transcriptional regulator n=1 Tax=Alloacidobacterium dinghuense TaxID=2763107 RepID=A0A7G8BK08_9BACT|nr:sigma-54 dependent transcriptional regulator [Alloacidobacterium dinghuense]QNI32878.1 sigma-54-dependent Fis family transcriptional regulator [Alloacidobacterium dinghuense]
MMRIGVFSEDYKLQPLLSSALGKEFQVILESHEDGITQMLFAERCDVVILDLDSNYRSIEQRMACCRRIAENPVPSVVMADDSLRHAAIELVQLGAHGHCRKPPSVRELKAMLSRAYENAAFTRAPRAVQEPTEDAVLSDQAVRSPQEPTRGEAPISKLAIQCDQMIGHSQAMQQVYDLVKRVANLNASVLVTGESGTGKELIARAIHNTGARFRRPFVAVSCGAIPETLIEAELFGHEKGAFTGTVGAREGYLEQAGDGTLFLDEIGELSLSTQVKLLRVLQQREFCRLGSSRLIPLRARLVFATHRDLSELVAQGKFRQDLFYRINVMRIDAPALQEHPEDIPSIASHFLRRYSEEYDKPMEQIEPDAMSLLQRYSWPGNVRELENVIQQAIILAKTQSVRSEDLPHNIREEDVVSISDYHPDGSFERQLREYKIRLAATAVREHNGNKTLAARSLSISRAYLHRLIRLADQPMEMEEVLVASDGQEFGTA